jgi:predicted nucleic acid-binding Zn ribbon protein
MTDMEDPRQSKRNYARWELDRVRYRQRKPSAPKRDIRSIADILKDVVEGLDEPVDEDLRVLREAWPKLVGQQIAKHSHPGALRGGALSVFVDHPGWMLELERKKRILLQKLQAQYANLRIRKLYVVLTHR